MQIKTTFRPRCWLTMAKKIPADWQAGSVFSETDICIFYVPSVTFTSQSWILNVLIIIKCQRLYKINSNNVSKIPNYMYQKRLIQNLGQVIEFWPWSCSSYIIMEFPASRSSLQPTLSLLMARSGLRKTDPHSYRRLRP